MELQSVSIHDSGQSKTEMKCELRMPLPLSFVVVFIFLSLFFLFSSYSLLLLTHYLALSWQLKVELTWSLWLLWPMFSTMSSCKAWYRCLRRTLSKTSAGLFKFVFNTILQLRLPWEIICLKSLPFSLFLREFYRESIRLFKTAMCQCGYRKINQVSVISFIIIIVETNYDFR